MAGASTETLTFLFTDLEGSTRLWEERPDAMRSALAHHDGLVRDAVEGHRGQVVKSTGDGVLATFRAALDGVAAAVTAQAALCATEWPDGVDLRVRMGLHAGEATERDGDWFGAEVNRAARVTAVAHGGQVVCTGTVAEQVRGGFGLVDLGEHRLRDLQSEVQLFQVEVPGASGTFPALRSLDAYRSNLPYELSSFIGRDEERRAIADRMRTARVVSIVGVGGVGKTRLALQVASESLPHHPDGVWLCELAQVLDPEDLPDAVAAAVGYTPPQGVPVAEGLDRFLERKDLLLVLDNCEHLVGPVAAWVATTTTAAARVSVLATSREALGVRGEHVSPLPSLAVPGAGDVASVLTSEAGALFAARAGEARGTFVVDDTNAQAVHDLCARLDGIPLAIELAAAQTKVMTPAEILVRLDKQFRLLTGGRRTSLERHQTLRAAIDWSYDLLSDDERALLTRLSVCAGGFDLDAAVAIAAGIGIDEFDAVELLAALVAKSLVERGERNDTTRYRQLEMIRQYAAEHLAASGSAEAARDDHARHYLALTVDLYGATASARDFEALARMEVETPNLAAAARWLLAADRVADLMQFFADLPFCDPFALPVTTLDELGAVAADAVTLSDPASRAGFEAACWVAASAAFFGPDIGEFRRFADLARRSSEDDPGARTALLVSTTALFDGDLDLAAAHSSVGAARARRDRDPATSAWTIAHHAVIEAMHEPDIAIAIADEALEIARRTGSTVARFYPLLGCMNSMRRIDAPRALAAAEETIRLDRTRRRAYLNSGRGFAARLHLDRTEIAEGLTLFREILRAHQENGERSVLSVWIGFLAAAVAKFDEHLAIELGALGESDAITHFAAFSNQAELGHLAETNPDAVAAARERWTDVGYDEAVSYINETLDRLIAEHRSSTSTSPPN